MEGRQEEVLRRHRAAAMMDNVSIRLMESDPENYSCTLATLRKAQLLQQQRIMIAMALALSPKILIADEPSGNLDEKSSKEFFNLLFNLKSKNKIIIYATHNRYFANLADCRLQLINGKLKSINARK